MQSAIKRLGNTVVGSVLDMRKSTLERALKDYDPQLYIKWNPAKNGGEGLWEVRRTPNEKTAVYKTLFNGHKVFELEHVENDLVHHVLDVHVLNYRVLDKIKSMDTWKYKNFADALEEQERVSKETHKRKRREEVRYALKQHKTAFKDLRDFTQQGINPFSFFFGEYD